jgi:hypothetical protein
MIIYTVSMSMERERERERERVDTTLSFSTVSEEKLGNF